MPIVPHTNTLSISLKSASLLTLGFRNPNGIVEKLRPQEVATRLLLIMVRFLAGLPHLLLVLPLLLRLWVFRIQFLSLELKIIVA